MNLSQDIQGISHAEFKKLSAASKRVVRAAEQAMANIDAEIMSDTVRVAVTDASGMPLGYRITTINDPHGGVFVPNDPEEDELFPSVEETFTQIPAEQLGVDPFLKRAQLFDEQRKTAGQLQPAPNPNDTPQMSNLEHLGLGFLTDPPSLPTQTVKLQLSGQMKFGATLNCHTLAVNDHVVVLVTDKRVKEEIIEISLDDPEITAELVLGEGEKIAVYPPVPGILTYDIGVLRHFVFIRKNE